jgi:hypothetical protein
MPEHIFTQNFAPRQPPGEIRSLRKLLGIGKNVERLRERPRRALPD